jgi:probable DNA metabolism protein
MEMEAFVRFEKLQGEIFFDKVDPDFDVLPLIRKHFMGRYQDQKWLIYDLRRNYALFYDLNTCDFFIPETDFTHKVNHALHESEDIYQKLWQTYFQKTNIKERANTKLHIQHVPKRYWKYLTEKVE